MEKVQAVEVSGDLPKNPGEFVFTRRSGKGEALCGLYFACPCGCGEMGGVAFDVPETQGEQGPKWSWNGSKEKPTIKPSIKKLSGCEYHGHLRDGVFVACEDWLQAQKKAKDGPCSGRPSDDCS